MRCPVCRAETEQPECRRCRADLSLLFALEEQRRQALATAYHYARQGWWRSARAMAEGVHTLRSDAESGRLLVLASLFLGDFQRAWDEYRTLALPAPPSLLESR